MVIIMAKGKTTKTKTRTVTKKIKSYVSRKPKTGGAISGAISGLLGALTVKMLGQWASPGSDLAVGYFMGNDTLMTLGGRQIGSYMASSSIGNGGALNGVTTLLQ